jgi:hypothetical protein
VPGFTNKLSTTERQQDVLKKVSNSTTSGLRLIQRANIVLLAFAGEDNNQDIFKEVGVNRGVNVGADANGSRLRAARHANGGDGYPEASWVFVVNNLNIYASETLVEWVAKTCGIELDLGKKETRRSAIGGEPQGVLVGQKPPHSLRVLAKAYVVAEPD